MEPSSDWIVKDAFNGVFADADSFNKKVHYLFLGCGTEENMGTKQLVESLRDMNIRVDFYESQGTAHEWLTWRRCLNEFIPHLFRGKQKLILCYTMNLPKQSGTGMMQSVVSIYPVAVLIWGKYSNREMNIRRFFLLLCNLVGYALGLPAQQTAVNPLIYADVPDMSMVRVDDTYYMSSTRCTWCRGYLL